jgi:hypothetical protein
MFKLETANLTLSKLNIINIFLIFKNSNILLD